MHSAESEPRRYCKRADIVKIKNYWSINNSAGNQVISRSKARLYLVNLHLQRCLSVSISVHPHTHATPCLPSASYYPYLAIWLSTPETVAREPTAVYSPSYWPSSCTCSHPCPAPSTLHNADSWRESRNELVGLYWAPPTPPVTRPLTPCTYLCCKTATEFRVKLAPHRTTTTSLPPEAPRSGHSVRLCNFGDYLCVDASVQKTFLWLLSYI